DRAPGTDPQTISFGTVNQGIGSHQVQFLQSPFQKLPGFQALLKRGAFRFRLVGTKKNVTPVSFQPQTFYQALQWFGHKWFPRCAWAIVSDRASGNKAGAINGRAPGR